MRKLLILAMAPVGNGLSGGDRIFIELARNAHKSEVDTTILTWDDGMKMCVRNNLNNQKYLRFIVRKLGIFKKMGFTMCYIARIFSSIAWAINYNISVSDQKSLILYSSSDFLMDSLPAYILLLKFPSIKWASTFYLTAPNPFRGYKEKGNLQMPTFRGITYWITQQPIYWLTRIRANFILVTSEPDAKKFPIQQQKGNVIVVQGGVDLENVSRAKKEIGKVEKTYDAVFQGRFHPQKGVLELIDIWKMVVRKKPSAKLIMIGDGPLMPNVKEKIKRQKLENNIYLAGYIMDGMEKYTIFAKSRVVVHPAIYDSGGMAAAEAMAWGLPGVSFDLEALKTYYPEGMIKVGLHNTEEFAAKILELLQNRAVYRKIQSEAMYLIVEKWDWSKRAKSVFAKLFYE